MNEQGLANLIRQYADGELSAEEASEFEARLAGDESLAQQVRFERNLRERVAASMRSEAPAAPPEVAERVRAALEAAKGERPEPERRSWLIGPSRVNVFAVAASLLLVAGAILFGIFGSPIDSWQQAPRPAGLLDETLEFVTAEHGRCATDAQHRAEKAVWTDRQDAEQSMTEYMYGRPVHITKLDDLGYPLVGAGRCCVPGVDRSGHILYRQRPAGPENGRAPMVSVFVVPDEGQYDLDLPGFERGRWYQVDVEVPEIGGEMPVRMGSDGRVVFFVVCCKPMDLPKVGARVADTDH